MSILVLSILVIGALFGTAVLVLSTTSVWLDRIFEDYEGKKKKEPRE